MAFLGPRWGPGPLLLIESMVGVAGRQSPGVRAAWPMSRVARRVETWRDRLMIDSGWIDQR